MEIIESWYKLKLQIRKQSYEEYRYYKIEESSINLFVQHKFLNISGNLTAKRYVVAREPVSAIHS